MSTEHSRTFTDINEVNAFLAELSADERNGILITVTYPEQVYYTVCGAHAYIADANGQYFIHINNITDSVAASVDKTGVIVVRENNAISIRPSGEALSVRVGNIEHETLSITIEQCNYDNYYSGYRA